MVPDSGVKACCGPGQWEFDAQADFVLRVAAALKYGVPESMHSFDILPHLLDCVINDTVLSHVLLMLKLARGAFKC